MDQMKHIVGFLEEIQNDLPDWLLVVGHYPIYSAGDHCDNSDLITYIKPLLHKYKVHAYISGHDHISEHLQVDGMEYFVAGAGSMQDSLKCTSAANLLWSGTGYSAFAFADVTPSIGDTERLEGKEISLSFLSQRKIHEYHLFDQITLLKLNQPGFPC